MEIVSFDFERSGWLVACLDTYLLDAERRRINWQHTYRVESLEGELLMVNRFLRYDGGAATFTVHKVLLGSHGKLELLEVQSLGNNVLFLGSSSDSVSVSALDFPFLGRVNLFYR
ncbi:hypothetical protein L6164_001806 [Bauhinia variegata]|uniref:Uncharacterized protein n=1 Tax=Bauhinia variegata TaxID=167791 RepID=A0ACB9QD57_BAUVA|nr:hypothetical protein L6164_001806 [Bauhinia variegata]